MSQPRDDYQAQADAWLAGLTDGQSAEAAALALAVVAARVATRLHNLGRQQATALKGEAAWPTWAGLNNASRTLVLQASTCRDLAAKLAGRGR